MTRALQLAMWLTLSLALGFCGLNVWTDYRLDRARIENGCEGRMP